MAELTLQDASGRLRFSTPQTLAAGRHDWQVDAPETPGVYLLRLTTAGGAQRTWRWVIQ